MSDTKPIIRICNGAKAWYTDHRRMEILRQIDFSVYLGESVALIGPSGAGKSTLLHVLGLLTPLDEGEMWFDDVQITPRDRSRHQRLRHQIGFVFQGAKLIPELTVLENVCLPLMHRGIGFFQQKKLARRELERVEMVNRMKDPPDQLNCGELMRVAIARAMVYNPRVLLVDEPTGNLNSQIGKDIVNLLLSRVGADKSLIMATHNPVLANLSSRLVFLKDGCIDSQNS